MEKYGFVYIWYDKKHKRFYIGCHWGTEDDGYICSSNWMRDAYKRRPKDFKRRILKRVQKRSELYEEEGRWLAMIKPEEVRTRYYNLHLAPKNHWSSDESKRLSMTEKLSKAAKEAMQRPEVRQRYLEGIKKRENVSARPKVREKKRQSMKERMAEKFPIEQRKKVMEFGSEEYVQFMKDSTKELWASRTKDEKAIVSQKISDGLKQAYSNGKKKPCPPPQNGLLWWNNGAINKKSATQPEGFQPGMLLR